MTTATDRKPWRQWTGDEKADAALETLGWLSDPRRPSQCSSTDPGPLPIRCLTFLSRALAPPPPPEFIPDYQI